MKRFIWIIFFLLVSTGVAIPGMYLTTVPTTEAITSYVLVLDNVQTTQMPFTSQSGTKQMVYEVTNVSNGQHSGTITAWNTLWGIKTDAVPFDFEKPGQLTNPVIELTSTDPRP
jgi:hypothetical protein